MGDAGAFKSDWNCAGDHLGLSSCPLVDSRLASRRLALVCKLPLIPNDLRRLLQTNQYPLAADLQRQAPTFIELVHRWTLFW